MIVGVNDNQATDLAEHLKTTDIQYKNVRKGDLIVDDHNVWMVVKVTKSKDELILHEVDENDCHIPAHGFSWPVTIIKRTSVKRVTS